MLKAIPTNNSTVNNVIDLDLSVTQKKKFRFNQDDSRILELNTSDMNIISRISKTYPKLTALQEKASKLMDGISQNDEDTVDRVFEDLSTVSERLREVDSEMRGYLDYIFNANVSEVTAPDGSMYDLFNGTFRYMYIIELLMGQYESNLQSEFSKMEKQLEKHTDKYTRR